MKIQIASDLHLESWKGEMPDDGGPTRFTLDVRGPQGRVVQHDYRPEADARADAGTRGSHPPSVKADNPEGSYVFLNNASAESLRV